MSVQWRFLQSTVARRAFYLFIISALIPVIFLVVFQLTQMSRQLSESSQKQVRQSVKTIGMDLIGRLTHLDNQLSLIGQSIKLNPEKLSTLQIEKLSSIAEDFSSLVYVSKKEEDIAIKGPLLRRTWSHQPIKPGQTVLDVTSAGDRQNVGHVILTYQITDTSFLVGQTKNIWRFDIPSSAKFWIIDAKGALIYRNTTDRFPSQLWTFKKKNDSTVFRWIDQERHFYLGYWTLFLKQRFQSEGWTVVLAEPQASVLAKAKDIYSILIPVIIFAILLTMLLSQAQIRRLLVPLEKLQQATRRIAKRDFTKPVLVHSDDEFEELAHSFNAMANQLNKQFKTLSILSELDESIVAQKDGEAVLKIIFEKLKYIMDYDVLILGVMSKNNTRKINLLTDNVDSSEVLLHDVLIDEQMYLQLKKEKRIEIDLSQDNMPSLLNGCVAESIQTLIIFPILHCNEPKAMIAVGFKKRSLADMLNNQALEDIFYRASVAFTHSEWENRLYRQAHYDELTGLPNRRLFRQYMTQALEKASHDGCCVVCMFIDLDNFKDVNDVLGHSIGDKFLNLVGQRMQGQMRDDSLLARFGGDEFTMILKGFSNHGVAVHEAEQTALAILNSLNQPFLLQNMEYFASASIGITIYPNDAKTSDDLLKFADMSMYQAKKKGKNLYRFYSEELEHLVVNRNELLQDMYRAIRHDEFVIFLQPKMNCMTNKLHGAEILVRWCHPVNGLMMPNDFLPIAEESNLINNIGDYIFKKTCQLLRDWQEKNYDIPRIAINLSARQFIQKDFAQHIIKTIERHNLDPGVIELEVTENALIDSFELTATTLRELKKAGCRLTLDDFGTGFSSMQYLMNLPLDTLKIDQVFVKQLPIFEKNISIIKAIKTLADSLKMDCVAEGVETREQMELLAELDCFIQQGFYFYQALPPEEFEAQFLKSNESHSHGSDGQQDDDSKLNK